jgi:hypothetical protein
MRPVLAPSPVWRACSRTPMCHASRTRPPGKMLPNLPPTTSSCSIARYVSSATASPSSRPKAWIWPNARWLFSRSTTRCCPLSSIPKRRCGPAHPSCTTNPIARTSTTPVAISPRISPSSSAMSMPPLPAPTASSPRPIAFPPSSSARSSRTSVSAGSTIRAGSSCAPARRCRFIAGASWRASISCRRANCASSSRAWVAASAASRRS